MNKKFMIYGLLLILMVGVVSATCTLTTNKQSYYPGGYMTIQGSCSSPNEATQSYNITITNGTNQITSLYGTTPATINTAFYRSYSIHDDANWSNANVTMNGTNLEGLAWFNVSGQPEFALLISQYNSTGDTGNGVWMGEGWAISFIVENNLGQTINLAQCQLDIENGDDVPIYHTEIRTNDGGKGLAEFTLTDEKFNEGGEYVAVLGCSCGNSYSGSSCVTSNGSEATLKWGSSEYAFTINTSTALNTITDKDTYSEKNYMSVCVNITNYRDRRISYDVFYNYRCSQSTNNNNTDRIIFGEYSETRGVSANTTQMQCHDFFIPEHPFLQGHNNSCYASVDIQPQHQIGNLYYSATSPIFTIISNTINPFPDWDRTDTTHWGTYINLNDSKYEDINGIGIGDVDIRFGSQENFNVDRSRSTGLGESGLTATQIQTYSCKQCNGSTQFCRLEVNDDGYMEIEVPSVSLTGCYYANITLYPSSQQSLQEISNKTGSFLFNIEVTDDALTSADTKVSVKITSQKEIGTGDTEGYYTCYINGYEASTTIEWDKSVEGDGTTEIQYKDLQLPVNLAFGNYSVTCKLGTTGFGNYIQHSTDTFRMEQDGILTNVVTSGEPLAVVGESEPISITQIKQNLQDFWGQYWPWVIGSLIFLCVLLCCLVAYKRHRENKKADELGIEEDE